MTSLNLLANGIDTTGVDGFLLYLIHTSQDADNERISFSNNLFTYPASLNSFINLSAPGCANCLCNFIAVFLVSPGGALIAYSTAFLPSSSHSESGKK